jgi:hypothetical protein
LIDKVNIKRGGPLPSFVQVCAQRFRHPTISNLTNAMLPTVAQTSAPKASELRSGTAVTVPEKEKLSIPSPESFPGEISRNLEVSGTKIPGVAKNRYYLFVHYLLYSSLTLDFTARLLFENS